MMPTRETELGAPVRDYFTALGYTVRSEVNGCDIAAVRGEELVIVELKRGFTIDLLLQATQRQCVADSVYVAIPASAEKHRRERFSKEGRQREHLLRRLGLGLLLVLYSSEGTNVGIEVVLHPAEESKPRRRTKKRNAIVREAGSRSADYNCGGMTGKSILTAYREEAIFLACCLRRHGPMTPATARRHGATERAQKILFRNVYGWFERQDRAMYALRDAAWPEICAQYEPLVSAGMNRLAAPSDLTPSESSQYRAEP